MSTTPSRIDLYTTIHKGIRALLFDLAASAARLDPADGPAIRSMVDQVDRTVRFLEEHSDHEERHVMPELRVVAPEVEASLARDHEHLEELAADVTRAAHQLARADRPEAAQVAKHLCRLVNQLTAAHLAHMHREETEANEALWSGFEDPGLAAIHGHIVASISPERMAEWMEFVLPAVSPAEREMMTARPEPSEEDGAPSSLVA